MLRFCSEERENDDGMKGVTRSFEIGEREGCSDGDANEESENASTDLLHRVCTTYDMQWKPDMTQTRLR